MPRPSVAGLLLAAWAGAAHAALAPAAPAPAAPVLTVVRTVKLGGDRPRDLALTADGATLFVACGTDAGVGGKLKLLSATTGRPVCKDFAVGGDPLAVAVSAAGKFAYVTGGGKGGDRAVRISLTRCEIAGDVEVPAGAGALAFAGDGKFAYVGGEAMTRLDIVEAQWNQVDGTIAAVPRGVRRALVAGAGRFLYLAAAGGKLVKVDLAANAVAKTLAVEGADLAASADGAQVFVGAGDGDAEIKVVSTATDAVEKTIDTELVPGAMAPGPEERWLWVALPRNGRVALLDLESGKLVASVKTGRRPARLVAAPDGKSVWVGNAGDATLSQVEMTVPAPVVVPAAVAPAPAPEPDPPALPVAASATRFTLAVSDLEAQGIAGSAAAIVTDWLRDEMFRNGGYRVLERRAMDAVMSEQALQQTGCTDADCAVKLGKMLNVQRMLLGTLGKFEDSYVVNARLVDVESGQLVWTGGTKGRTIDEVESGIRRVARDLSRQSP